MLNIISTNPMDSGDYAEMQILLRAVCSLWEEEKKKRRSCSKSQTSRQRAEQQVSLGTGAAQPWMSGIF